MNIRNVCTNKSALNNKKKKKKHSKVVLISLKIQIQTQTQQKTNCEEKHSRTAWFYSKKKQNNLSNNYPAIVHRRQKSKTKLQPQDQSSRISKPRRTSVHRYVAEYCVQLENKLHRATTTHSCYLKLKKKV